MDSLAAMAVFEAIVPAANYVIEPARRSRVRVVVDHEELARRCEIQPERVPEYSRPALQPPAIERAAEDIGAFDAGLFLRSIGADERVGNTQIFARADIEHSVRTEGGAVE